MPRPDWRGKTIARKTSKLIEPLLALAAKAVSNYMSLVDPEPQEETKDKKDKLMLGLFAFTGGASLAVFTMLLLQEKQKKTSDKSEKTN